jgi:hypothetical protein
LISGPEFTTQYIIYCSRAPKESRAVVFRLTPSPTTARDACPGNRAGGERHDLPGRLVWSGGKGKGIILDAWESPVLVSERRYLTVSYLRSIFWQLFFSLFFKNKIRGVKM